MTEPTRADHRSTLGRLQRGRGAGWLAALDEPDPHALLLACLDPDPRWDGQVESRAEYYGTLALATGLPTAEVASLAARADDSGYGLPTCVLGELALRGRTDAVTALVELLRPGPTDIDLLWIIGGLLDVGVVVPDLSRVLVDRFPSDDLVRIVRDSRRQLPWAAWSSSHPELASALASVDAARDRHRAGPGSPPPNAPIGELLAHEWGRPPPKATMHRLRHQATPAELLAIEQAASDPASTGFTLAMFVLAARNDPIGIDPAGALLKHKLSGPAARAAQHYLRHIDDPAILAAARSWLGVRDRRGVVAQWIMAARAEATDVPTLRTILRDAWDAPDRDMYEICSMIDALALHPELGPFDELHVVFDEVEYSFARRRAARAMTGHDPLFATQLATECLWDCESETRAIGAARAPFTPEVIRRLEALADDGLDERMVSDAARDRLTEAGLRAS